MENTWCKNCNNCEHSCVCDYEKYHAFCDNWVGWIPVEAELPKEYKTYIEDEVELISAQVFVKILDTRDNTISYNVMRTMNGKFSPNYVSCKVVEWKACT